MTVTSNQQLPIFIINLKRSPERKIHMQKKLDELNLKATFVEAVDGKGKVVNDFYPHYDEKLRKKKFGRNLRSTEVGCSLSHLKTIQQMYDDNIEQAIVLEDDIVFLENFLEGISICKNLPQKFECVRFYVGTQRKTKTSIVLGNIEIARTFRNVAGTQGYYINRQGMKKVLDNAYPIMYPWDKFLFGYWLSDLNVYTTKPNIVYGEDINEFPTTIDYNEKDKYKTLSDKWARLSYQVCDEVKAFIYRIRNFTDYY